MFNLGGKYILVCAILILCGFSFAAPDSKAPAKNSGKPPAGKQAPSSGFSAQIKAAKAAQAVRDSLAKQARLDSIAKVDSITKVLIEAEKQAELAKAAENARRDSIARIENARQDSIAKAEAAKKDAAAKAEAAKQDSIARAEATKRDAATKAEAARQDSIARAEAAKKDAIAKAEAAAKRDSIAKAEATKRDSIAKAEAAKRDSIARVEAARRDSIAAARQDSIARANAPPYPHYEAYLDSLEAYVRYLLPGIERLDSARKATREETLKPKSDYETKAAYQERAANFDKNKQIKLDNLEKEYFEKERGIGRLVTAATIKEDFQPDWGKLLEKNTNADGYKSRIDTIQFRINEMRVKIAQLNKQLGSLLLQKGDSAKIAKNLKEKNFTYMARLDNAKILMQDYILQEHAKVLRTDRKKVDMSLGAYYVDNQEFELGMRDIYSEKFPFDFVGRVRIPPEQAEIIDRRTDDFTVSIDYINFPFMLNGAKVFPGAKKAYVFWKDKEFKNEGVFRNVSGFEDAPGYFEWAMRADSLISGKLEPQDLDASFAMKKVKFSESTGPSWWTIPKVVRILSFTLSAASLGAAIMRNSKVDKKLKEAKDTFGKAETLIRTGDFTDDAVRYDYETLRNNYYKQKEELHDAENLRNILYISAGAFGAIGIVSFAF